MLSVEGAAIEDMRVDHGDFHIFVAGEFLDGADVVAIFEEMSHKAVAEGG